jgi:hypothetical protein
MTQSGSRAATYADITETVKSSVTIVPRTIAQSEQIARYFTEDLEKFIADTHIDLMRQLDIPPSFARNDKAVISKLFSDLSHMLRDSMITGIHLLLSKAEIDVNTHCYPLLYHAEYTIRTPNTATGERDLRPDKAHYSSQRIGGYLAPPRDSLAGAKFALLLDWNMTLSERRRNARPPDFWFNWVPMNDRYDATSLVRFRAGGMAFDGAVVVNRGEAKPPGF